MTAIVVTSSSFSNHPLLRQELLDLGVDVVFNDQKVPLLGESLYGHVGKNKAEIAIVGLEKFDEELFLRCPHLKFIAKFGVGLDGLDLSYMEKKDIGLGWSPGVNKRSVSELVLAFMLGHCRNVIPSIIKMRAGIWEKNGGVQISQKKIGIVGLGHVGADLASLLQVFGCELFYNDIVDKTAEAKKFGAKYLSFDEMVRTVDILTMHVPSTPLTRNMLSKKNLSHCKPNLLVINTARGDIIQFDDMIEAVREGKVSGYASDTFVHEPIDGSQWQDFHNLYFTPHIGGNANEAVLAMGRSAIAHVKLYLGKKVRQS